MIEFKGVSKAYEDAWAVKWLDLCIADGAFLAVVGPSGSGKTTLLNLAAGLVTPTVGEVMVGGASLYALSSRDRLKFRSENFGFVFQSFNLIPYLTAVQNVEVPLYIAGKDAKEQEARAWEMLERVRLDDKGGRFPDELSAGEQQRVAVARALANEPNVVFADEPTGNLDSDNGRQVMIHLREMSRRGATVVLVTHDAEMAAFADQVISLGDGRVCNAV